jgi:tetratricopeptide (TPR) repeat protein
VIAVAIVAPLYLADHYLGRSYAAATPAGGLVEAERAQGFNPLDSRLPQREAELAMEAGDWERVEKSYGRAIRLNPEHYAPRMFLATFHERRGEPDKADPHYREASKLNPLDENLALRAAPR